VFGLAFFGGGFLMVPTGFAVRAGLATGGGFGGCATARWGGATGPFATAIAVGFAGGSGVDVSGGAGVVASGLGGSCAGTSVAVGGAAG
jgi:hypothetical protein